MATLRFFPLDATYRITDGKAVIYLFGRSFDGQTVCVTDENFRPYFYVLSGELDRVQSKIELLKVENERISAFVTGTEIVKRRYNGKEVRALKVYTNIPGAVPIIKDTISQWDFVDSVHEYDILFARRYLIDRGIVPFTPYEVEGEFVSVKSKVPVFRAERIEQRGEDIAEEPRILAFDIETYYNEREILPDKNPIIMLAFYGKDFRRVFTWKRFRTSDESIEFVESEAELIEKFKETIEHFKPEIITGYFSDGFDFPYIETRARKYKISLDIGLDYSELKINRKGGIDAKIAGINHVDVFRYVQRIFGRGLETESYSLNSVAYELIGEKKLEVNLDEMSKAWDEGGQKIEEYCRYNLHDAKLTYELCRKLLPNMVELVKIIGLPVDEVIRMGFSQLVEWYLLRQAPRFNEIAPNRPEHGDMGKRREESFKGAFVFEPKPGLYKNIAVFDFRSLYPSIISSHNISGGTLNCKCCGDEKVPFDDGKTNYWFCKRERGFLPTVIGDLIEHRVRIKEMIRKQEQQDMLLAARENVLKLLANSFYGYYGFFGARWYSIESAQSTTAYGRYYIHKVISKAEKEGFTVLYSDTDSIFLLLDKKTKEDAEKFMESVNLELPGLMELEYEGHYPAGIFVQTKDNTAGAKKKYALISDNGILKIRGFETVRRNWSLVAKELQENVLKIILKEGDAEKALVITKGTIKDLRDKKIPVEKVIIKTQITKEIGSYETVGPHVAIAKRLEAKGVAVAPGTIISYVVTEIGSKVRDKAKLPEEVREGEYDAEYYINNQVVPAVEKIFEVLGHSKDELVGKEQGTLGRFF
ncbi:ribonuclease H-like domain-containing protein [Candidatus Woesearchaeota archaeon]|nr:ribonuclease H-like domain-containing protein [Candidatus Woesearchaeota archaeon]